MSREMLICMLLGLLISLEGETQAAGQQGNAGYTYYHPSQDKESWQRLNLLLSATDIVVGKEGQVEHDTCLYIVSRSLGLSRFSVLAEGIDAWGLIGQSQWIDRQEPGMGVRLLAEATGRKHLQLLLLLGAYYAFQPHSYYRYRDSAEYYLNKAMKESKLLKEGKWGRQALCLLGKIYVQANDPKGDSIFNRVIDQSREMGDKETEARAFAYRGIYTKPLQSTLLKKIEDLQAASDLYQRTGNEEARINVLTDLGYLLVVTGQFQPAHDFFLKALTLAETIRFPYTHYSTDNLAMVGTHQGKFGESLRYALQSIKISESCRDSLAWGHFYNRLAGLYIFEGRGRERQDIIQKAINRFVIDRDPTVYNILVVLAGYMAEEGRAKAALDLTREMSKKVAPPETFADQLSYHLAFSNCYLDLDELGLAEMHIRKMDSVEARAALIRGPFRRAIIEAQFASLFMKRKQYRKAKEYFGRYFATTLGGQRSVENDLSVYQLLMAADSALGDHLSLIAHYKEYTQLIDSSFRITKIRQAEELQVMYETQEKEGQIALLHEQAVLERANLKQATLVRNLTLAGIGAATLIAILLYRQNRLKQKNNKAITDKNEQLQQLLVDREWLLKEIHHRVKNNLQIVTSLLNSQAVYINNEAALTAIQDSKRRVYAMSLIHQKLYQSKNIATIAMPGYVNELLMHVLSSLGAGSRIVVEQDIEALNLDVSQAIPLGLIINECMVNAIKYAFPQEGKGVVRISLQQDGIDHLLLKISDNGIGLPGDFDIMEQNSLGLDLVRGLAKQLKGGFDMESNNGLHVKIRFSVIRKQIQEESFTVN